MDAYEKGLDHFLTQFAKVADEARDHGLSVVVLIENSDPISRQASVSTIVRGTLATTIGLLNCALMDIQAQRLQRGA